MAYTILYVDLDKMDDGQNEHVVRGQGLARAVKQNLANHKTIGKDYERQ